VGKPGQRLIQATCERADFVRKLVMPWAVPAQETVQVVHHPHETPRIRRIGDEECAVVGRQRSLDRQGDVVGLQVFKHGQLCFDGLSWFEWVGHFDQIAPGRGLEQEISISFTRDRM
jgi:hypothetical protein